MLRYSDSLIIFSGGSRISRRGGLDLVGGPWTPEAVTFRKFCISKRKNLDLRGGVHRARPPKSANDISLRSDLKLNVVLHVINCSLPCYVFN